MNNAIRTLSLISILLLAPSTGFSTQRSQQNKAATPNSTAIPDANAKQYNSAPNIWGIGAGGYADLASGYRHSMHLAYERSVGTGLLELSVRPSLSYWRDYQNSGGTTLAFNNFSVAPQWMRDYSLEMFMEVGIQYSFRPYREFPLKNGRSAFIMNLWRGGMVFGWRMYHRSVTETDVGTFGSQNNWQQSGFEFGFVYKPEIGFRLTRRFAMTLNVPFQITFMPKYIYYPRPGIGTHLNFKFFL